MYSDSANITGLKIVDNGDYLNSQYCAAEKDKKIINYFPYEVNEYGFNDGRIYVSKKIEIDNTVERVFLLRLVNDKTSLYYYKGKNLTTFFLEKDSTTFIELPKYNLNNQKNDFHKDLAEWTSGCPYIQDATKLVSYNKKSMTKLIKNFNSCKPLPFPIFRYGILFGIGTNKLENYSSDIFDYKYQTAYIPGIFIDYPLDMSNFSLHTDLFYEKNDYNYSYNQPSYDINMMVNTTSINMPVLIRYTYPSMKLRPFVNAGFIFTYNIINNSKLITSTPSNHSDIVGTNIDENPRISKSQIGLAIGCGVEYKLNYKHSLFIEFRSNNIFSLHTTEVLNKTEFQLITGVNI